MDSFIQVRTNEKDKEEVQKILEELGTNMSQVVNMLMKQIIITRSIPFEIKLDRDITIAPSKVKEVKALIKNLPETVEEAYVYGKALQKSCKANEPLDVYLIGKMSLDNKLDIYNAIDSDVNIEIETRDDFEILKDDEDELVKKVLKDGFLVYKKGKKIEIK